MIRDISLFVLDGMIHKYLHKSLIPRENSIIESRIMREGNLKSQDNINYSQSQLIFIRNSKVAKIILKNDKSFEIFTRVLKEI